MEVDDTKSDSSSDSCDEEALEAERLKKVAELTTTLKENPHYYDMHVELISILRSLGEFEKLREARNVMSKHFPLASPLWTAWLQDEIKIATSSEEKKFVEELFERAVKDYMSVDVWLEYVQFAIGLQSGEDEKGPENVRTVFERSLSSAGLHVVKGTLLWETYIEFEVVMLAMIEGKDGVPELDIENQKKRILNLFKRHLSCPHLDLDDTFERFKMWMDENNAKNLIDLNMVENVYKESKQKLRKIEKFEESLLENPANFNDYLEHEKSKEGTPSRVLCLYERILNNQCLNAKLWKDYISYINTVLKDSRLSLDVSKRSLRNCPWDCELAVINLRCLEANESPHADVIETVERALLYGFPQSTNYRDLWLAFLEYMRRRYDGKDISREEEDKRLDELRAAFSRAVDHLSEIEESDPECTVSQFWARVEAKCAKDMEKARLIWNGIFDNPNSRTSALWSEFINLEMCYGDSKHLRKVFPRALQQVSDNAEYISMLWTNFERDEGTLESYLNCIAKCTQKIEEMKKRREKEEQTNYERQSYNYNDNRRKPKRAGLGFQQNNKKLEPKGFQQNKKPVPEPKEEVRLNRKRPLEDAAPSPAVSPEKKKKTEDIVGDLLKEEKPDHGVTIKHDPSKDNRTAFVSNLDYSTDDATLRSIFEADGTITDLRVVKDFKGRSKGFAFVEFQNQESAAKAISRDRQLIGGRPMYVSRCDPDKETRGSGFKFSNNMERNKLFVKNLPMTTTEEELKEIFGKCAGLKDVRNVTFRNGHSKGIAYIEYTNATFASQALLKTNGITVGDKTISVAISDPPIRQSRNEQASLLQPPVASLGGGRKEFGARGKGRTQISFLPRNVALRAGVTTSREGIENLSIASPNPDSAQTQESSQQ